MKTKDKHKKSLSLVAQTAASVVCGFSVFVGTGRGPKTRRSALHPQNRRNKARMSMKTKDRRFECFSGAFGTVASDRDSAKCRRRLRFQGSPSRPSADGHAETMKCHSERSEESCSALGRPPQKGQGEIPRFARNDRAFQGRNFAIALQDWRNKARMSMKTKDRLLECGSEATAVEFRLNGGSWRSCTPWRLRREHFQSGEEG